MKDLVTREGQGAYLAMNVKGTSFLADKESHKIEKKNVSILNSTSTCLDANGDEIYGFDDTQLESCTRSFLCGSGYKVKSVWLITTELPLLQTGSKGRLRLKNSSNTIVYSNTNITPVTIEATANTDVNFPNSTVYRVTYETGFIDQSTYESATSLENGVLISTDCSRTETVQYLATFSLYIGGTSSNPCLRVDKTYFNPSSFNSDGTVDVLGSYAGCNVFGQC